MWMVVEVWVMRVWVMGVQRGGRAEGKERSATVLASVCGVCVYTE